MIRQLHHGHTLWLLALLGAGLFNAPAARADADRFTLRLSSIHIDGDARFKGHGIIGDNGVGYDGERMDLGARTVPRIEGSLHFSARNRLLLDYFQYGPEHHYVLDHDVDIDGVRVPAGSQATAAVRFRLGGLLYDRALVERLGLSFGLQFGVAAAEIEGRVRAEAGALHVHGHEQRRGVAPVLGARLAGYTANRRWGFIVQGQYVNTRWGSLDGYSGFIRRMNALVEYRPTPGFGFHAGFDSFRVDVDHDFGALTGGVSLRFAGPTAGVTLAF